MTRKLVVIAFILMSIPTFAQREVFFSTISRDSVSISNTQGIFMGPAVFHGGAGFSFDVGYFNERKMSNTTSLILGGNIYLEQYVKSVRYPGYSDSYRYITPVIDYGLGMGLSAFVEPRWYFAYKNRYEKGRNVKLNTGCFIGLPLELNTNNLFADSTKLELNSQLTPILGYRLGFSQHFFIETSAGIGISLFHLPGIQVIPHLRIKAAYTF